MTKIRIITEQLYGYTRQPNYDDPYDRGHQFKETNVLGIEAIPDDAPKGNRHYDFESKFDVNPGDEVILVWCEYSTGSTFGTASGCISYIDVFKNPEEADDCMKRIFFDQGEQWSFDYTVEGKTFQAHKSWKGYFERLDEVYVETFKVR